MNFRLKQKRTVKGHVQLAAVILKDEQGKVLIHKRPQSGLLANLWEFPNVEIHQPLLTERKQIIEFIQRILMI